MKKFLYTLLALALLISCAKEEELVPDYDYEGPFPAIPDGPSDAQKLCFKLFQKYDIAFYYTLEDEAAITTEVGHIQTNPIYDNNPDAIPAMPANEDKALKQLQLIEQVYDLFPIDAVLKNIFRFQSLVDENPAYNNLYYSDKVKRYHNAYWEDQCGGLMYGDLGEDSEIDPIDARNDILLAFFTGIVNDYKFESLPKSFTSISAPYYRWVEDEEEGTDNYELCFVWDYIYDEEEGEEVERLLYDLDTGYEYGFVGFEGADAYDETHAWSDMVSYGYWLLTTSEEEINSVIENYPLVAAKVDIARQWYMDSYKINLDEIRPLFQAIK